MKTTMLLLSAVLIAGAGVSFAAPPADQASSKVKVAFEKPENFTDIRHSSSMTDTDLGYLELLKEHIVQRAPAYLAEGQVLTMTFTDVDLAGDFEPWRGPDFDRVRIVKDIYPPRLVFTYKVTDAAGAVVKEGSERLVELGFQIHGSPTNAQDALRYEKVMIDNWLRNTMGPRKASSAKK